MNEIEREDLCSNASACLRHGVGQLSTFPRMLVRIIEDRAWERRKLKTGAVVELKNLRELITRKPLEGWGEDPKKVEAVIKDDPDALVMFREAMKGKPGRPTKGGENDSESEGNKVGGTDNKAYALDRLQRESPELFEAVRAGEMSANAAAIQAGFRKPPPTPEEKCVAGFRKSESRLVPLKIIVDELEPHEISILLDWLNERHER